MIPFFDTEGAHGHALKENCDGSIIFRTSPPGYELDWHCAPRRQYVIQLQGHVELTTGNGNSAIAGPGDVILAEDLTGQGHQTRVVGTTQRFYAVIPLLDEQ